MEWDERITMWRIRHYKVVARVIGDSVVGTQGTPVEVLGRLIHHTFFPELWRVRNDLTALSQAAGLMATVSLRDEAVELLQRLLRLNTVNPPGNETIAAELLRDYLAASGRRVGARTRGRPSGRISWRACAAATGRASRFSVTRTPWSRTPRSGSATRGPASSSATRCGGVVRST